MGLLLGVGSVSAEDQTASFAPSDFNGQGTSGTGSAISATVDGVTFSCDKGYGAEQIRCYSGSKITISSDNTIKSISFTLSSSYTGGLNASYTGLSTTSWTKTLSSQARITALTVTYESPIPNIATIGNDFTTSTLGFSATGTFTRPTITFADGTTEGEDYEVEWSSNDASVLSVTPEGTYTTYKKRGSVQLTLTVEPYDNTQYKAVSKSYDVEVWGKYDAMIAVADKSLAYGESYTLAEGEDYETDGVITLVSSNPSVVSVDGMKVTAVAVGSATITASAAEGENYLATTENTTFNVTVTAPVAQTDAPNLDPEVLFNETFNKSEGSGGRDDTFSGNIGTSSLTSKTDENWASIGNNGAYHCIKLGTNSGSGTVKTRKIALTGEGTLTFATAGWNTGENTVTVTATGGTINGSSSVSITMTNGIWSEHSYSIIGNSGELQLEFSMKRGFLDDVQVVKPAEAVKPTITLAASGYATYCSEYPLDLSTLDTDVVRAWYVSAVNDTEVTFSEITGSIAGGTPFILYGTPSTAVELDFASNASALTGNNLVGTLAPTWVATTVGNITNYGLSNGQFVKINSGVVKANKAYLPVASSNARLNIVFDSESTGISTIESSAVVLGEGFYNLSGQRVEQPTRGLYIVNGKKVVLK